LKKWFFRVAMRIRWIGFQLPRRIVHNFTGQAFSEIRRHGIKGFILRIPFYLRHFHKYLPTIASAPLRISGTMFNAQPLVFEKVRLHPELTGVGEPIDACISVIIPTLNAGEEFRWLLRKLSEQRGVRCIEVVVIDSGSSDCTVEYARLAGCRVIEIPPLDFTHSYSRNTGAAAASGDYLLFMVQDAYPIGDYWAYAMLIYLQEHADVRLAAVSCAEFGRSDSDAMYDCMIATHYRFLGCSDYDRIGEYIGADRLALQTAGQLSDVACLIPRALFNGYQYRGDYAEDLDLGIRLIKDGYRVAMLASVKVVHSHNRPPYYYLKRSFVDVVFLARMFDDFAYTTVTSLHGLIAGITSVAAYLSAWLREPDDSISNVPVGDYLDDLIRKWRRSFTKLHRDCQTLIGDEKLDAYLSDLRARYLPAGAMDRDAHDEALRFADNFLARLEHFSAFTHHVYCEQDSYLHHEIRNAICKVFASSAGSALAFMYMGRAEVGTDGYEVATIIKNELTAGI
jgi:glycosyltransferase involved in cell wall biosynthesis